MNINITGHGFELTSALRNYVNEKFSRLDRHSDHITQVNVVLSTENKRQKADVTLFISHATDIHAETTTEDMYASIDEIVENAERMLLKQKGKSISSKRQVKDNAYEDVGTE